MNFRSIYCVIFVICYDSDKEILSKSFGFDHQMNEFFFNQKQSGPVSESVWDKRLVKEELTAADIVSHHASYFNETQNKRIESAVLAYVTPVRPKSSPLKNLGKPERILTYLKIRQKLIQA